MLLTNWQGHGPGQLPAGCCQAMLAEQMQCNAPEVSSCFITRRQTMLLIGKGLGFEKSIGLMRCRLHESMLIMHSFPFYQDSICAHTLMEEVAWQAKLGLSFFALSAAVVHHVTKKHTLVVYSDVDQTLVGGHHQGIWGCETRPGQPNRLAC